MAEYPNREVTLREVARASHVHPSTASRVLTGDPTLKVPAATRERVVSAARTLGYRANMVARGLRLKQTFTLGLLIPDISDPVFALMYRGAEEAADERGYHVLIANTDDDPKAQERRIQVLLDRNVDGLIITTALRHDATISRLTEASIPFVLLNRKTEDGNERFVTADDVKGAYIATRHLIELGHGRIAHLAGPQTTTTAHSRLLGYKKALKEAGLSYDERYVRMTSFREEAGEEGMRELLTLAQPPTAIFAANDMSAIGAITIARRSGLTVPDDVAVVGYNDIPLARMFEPALSSVKTPLVEMGREATRMIVNLVSQDEKDRVAGLLMTPELVVRASSVPGKR